MLPTLRAARLAEREQLRRRRRPRRRPQSLASLPRRVYEWPGHGGPAVSKSQEGEQEEVPPPLRLLLLLLPPPLLRSLLSSRAGASGGGRPERRRRPGAAAVGGAPAAAAAALLDGASACEDQFACKELESLFQNYNLKLEQTSTLKALAVLIALTGSLALLELLSAPGLTISKGSHPVHCIIFLSLFIVTNVKYLQVTQLQQIVKLTLLFSFTFAFLCCPFSLGAHGAEPPSAPEQGMWQLLLVTFISYALLPVRTLLAIVFGVVVAASHLIVALTSASAKRQSLWRTLVANAILFVSVNLYGVFVRILTERAQRKAFLQARNCIEDRLKLEDENEKQVS
ncbi:Hypothetical predicted protein [Podarcis lilfordi]|uniref:Adenylate cyclase N-terminal domain-containing protein n=1 Tax=Podarcis lilfordi TaxID=74358 RepID=A0AA35PJB3_9SAUR|nr:Hypothetical predicted protein [Podarcis lilfordi]